MMRESDFIVMLFLAVIVGGAIAIGVWEFLGWITYHISISWQ